jgi:transcriptional regulator with XRE-family HTH domain
MSGPRKTQYLTDPVLTGFNVTVADNIRRFRKARGLSRTQLASMAGLNLRNVANAEAGLWSHSFWTLAKLAAALRQPLGAFTAVNDA